MRAWRKTHARPRSRRRQFVYWFAGVVGVFLLVSSAGVLALRWIAPPFTAFMLLDPVARDAYAYEWVAFERVATGMPIAVIAAEDQKFPMHWGFDVDSIRDAIDERRDGGRLRGASTISQQVAKNLFLWPGQSLLRKGIEAYFTLLIETAWPKRRILEVYINVAEFGPGVYGVAAASRRFFGKSADQLTDTEAALLAAALPSPKRFDVRAPSAYMRERQRWILGQMQRLRSERVLASLP